MLIIILKIPSNIIVYFEFARYLFLTVQNLFFCLMKSGYPPPSNLSIKPVKLEKMQALKKIEHILILDGCKTLVCSVHRLILFFGTIFNVRLVGVGRNFIRLIRRSDFNYLFIGIIFFLKKRTWKDQNKRKITHS
jgi:hypothetical protein